DHIDRGPLGRLLPALHDDTAGFAVESDHRAVRVQFTQKRGVWTAGGESGRSHNDAIGALFKQFAGALGRTDAPADSHGRLRGKLFHEAAIGATPHGGVEIDDLNLGKALEGAKHFIDRSFKSFFTALDQLNDFAVHQIDAGNNHAGGLTGTRARSSASFKSVMVYLP